MPTEVLYRKWRPQRFADVSGQEAVTRTLVNALRRGKVSHAYLFSGPRGTGKTTMGRLLAKAVNCGRNAEENDERPGEPCNECPSCVTFLEGRALDLIELDGASNRGIDDIRDLREAANYAPTGGAAAHKVYLIDEVHMLTDPAFNALLKTLEEPPPHVIFILATTDAHRVPATILSRCQRHDFKRIPLAAVTDRLAYIAGQESIAIPREGLELIARSATGSLRDAINLLEQVCDSYGTEASLEAVREGLGLIGDERAGRLALDALRGDLAGGLATIGEVRDDGLDLRQFQREVVQRLRELLLVQSGVAGDGQLTPEQTADLRASTEGVPRERLVHALRLFAQADLRADPLSPLPLELALAETIAPQGPPAGRADASPAPDAAAPERPAGPQRTVATPTAPPVQPRTRPATQRPAGGQQSGVPSELRKLDLNKPVTPEEIAAHVGSTRPVIREAADEADDAASAASPNSSTTASPGTAPTGELSSLVERMRVEIKPSNMKLAGMLNGSCHAKSWQDGILTLVFYADFHRKQVEDNRRVYEDVASALLGAPVSIRCIMGARPAKQISSRLVQHAVENHGARIVSEE